MSEIKLKPCPFCGGATKEQQIFELYSVHCAVCGARTAPYDSRAQAIEAWNRRAE